MIRRALPAGLSARTTPAMQAAVAWAQGRSQREQILLGTLAVLAAATLFWFLIPRPLLEARATAIDRIDSYETIKSRLTGQTPVAGAPAVATGSLEQVVPARATEFGLTPTLTREDGALVVTVTDARYDAVVPWLAALESQQGMTLSRVSMEQRPTPGTINATFRIAE